jgi:signal transduction histidine kinase
VQIILAFFITQSFERLIEAARMKAEFVSIVSHQLRAPLTNLKWAVDFLVLKKDARPEQRDSYFQMVKENTLRMRELVDDLLTVARLEQGRLPLHKKTFSLDKLVESIVGEFQAILQASNIQLILEGKDSIPEVFSDASRIRHIIANFLDNAIRYTKKSGAAEKKIIIRYSIQGAFVRFEIQDNGIGIPQEEQKYIFQKFFRSSNATYHDTQGSGLGLHIAASIIKKGGGMIGFQSEEQKGSTFWFTVPINK